MLEVTRATLSSRMATIAATFDAHAPIGCQLYVPSGGMCAWLRLPDQLDSHAVLVAVRRRGVSFKPGDLFSSSGAKATAHRNFCRIVVAHYEEATLVRAVKTLCEVIDELLDSLTESGDAATAAAQMASHATG